MSTRAEAIAWLKQKRKIDPPKPFYSSKFYTEKESWNKQQVWWFRIPESALESYPFIYLLCAPRPGEKDFRFLKVPVSFFKKNRKDFVSIAKNTISIYLSADNKMLYKETRANSGHSFAEFVS